MNLWIYNSNDFNSKKWNYFKLKNETWRIIIGKKKIYKVYILDNTMICVI